MCGRFFLTATVDDVQAALPGLVLPDAPDVLPPRYNIAPGQPVAVVVNAPEPRFDYLLWGLVPSWAKDAGIASRLINARAETLAEKPAFRAALRRRRCLILANGFYEWYLEPGAPKKTPMCFRLRDGELFAFAGLWEVWLGPDGSEIFSCAIITTAANPLISRYHARMPVILDPAHYDAWLSHEELPPKDVMALLKPVPAAGMVAYPVSTLVNNARVNAPECMQAVGPEIVMKNYEHFRPAQNGVLDI